MDDKLVSVVIPVYKPIENYLRKAIKSILNQTYCNIEVLLIVDGDATVVQKIVDDFADHRIRMIINKERGGLPAALNRGINEARGVYICRMDSDDISHSDRIQKQVSFLEKHKEIDLVASYARTFGAFTKVYKSATNYRQINAELIVKNPIVHPTVLLRLNTIRKYELEYTKGESEDYRLWVDMVFRYKCKLAVIPEILLDYRIHAEQATVQNINKINTEDRALLQVICEGLGVTLDEYEFNIFNNARRWRHLEKIKARDYIRIYKKFRNGLTKEISSEYLRWKLFCRYMQGLLLRLGIWQNRYRD